MNKTEFKDFVHTCSGYMSSQAEILDNLCTNIEDGLAATLPGFDALATVASFFKSYKNDEMDIGKAILSDADYDNISDIVSESKHRIQANILNKVFCFDFVESGNFIEIDNIIDPNDETRKITVASIDKSTHAIDLLSSEISDVTQSIRFDWSTFVSRMAEGRALPSAVASVGHFMTSYGSDPSTTIIEGARNLLSQYKSLTGSTINELIMVVTGGVSAMIDYVKNLYLQMHDAMSNGNEDNYFSSTDIDVANFSCGMILSTVGTILQAAGLVLVGISRIAAIVVSLTGTIVNAIGQIALKYATNYDDTLFKWNGVDQAKCFKFVVAQGTIVCPYLARLMIDHNTTVCSIRSFETGSVLFAHLVSPSDGVNSLVQVEEHLSIDFDIFDRITYLADDSRGNPVFSVAADESHGWLTLLKDYTGNLSSDPKAGHARFNVVIANQIENAQFIDFRVFGQSCYDPISLTSIDKFKNVYDTEIKRLLSRRLVSALFLWAYPKFIVSFPYQGSTISTGYYSIYSVPTTINGSWNSYVNGVFALACRYLYYACENGRSSYEYLNNTQCDELFQGLIDCFDGIPLSSANAVNLNTLYKLSGAYDVTSDFTNPITFNLSWMTQSGAPVLKGMFSYAFCLPSRGVVNIYTAMNLPRSTSVEDLTEDSFASCWPTNLGVDLPKLKFSAFITGLIIDAVIIVASIVVTIWAVTSYMKLKRKAQRAAVDADAKMYEYEAAVQKGADKETRDTLFKQYRQLTLKSNILNFSTGGLTKSLFNSSNTNTDSDISALTRLIIG